MTKTKTNVEKIRKVKAKGVKRKRTVGNNDLRKYVREENKKPLKSNSKKRTKKTNKKNTQAKKRQIKRKRV